METQIVNATEYRNVSLAQLSESKTNPRRTFEETCLEGTGRVHPYPGRSLAFARAATDRERLRDHRWSTALPRRADGRRPDRTRIRIVHLSDAAALEAQLVENLIRSEIHPMEEAQGFRALLDLEDPKYSIEQIAAKVGKSPVFVASRLKLSDLVPAAVEAFYADADRRRPRATVGEAPRRPAGTRALKPVSRRSTTEDRSPPVSCCPSATCNSGLTANILLVLKDAPFNKRDAQLVPDRWQLCRLPETDRT